MYSGLFRKRSYLLTTSTLSEQISYNKYLLLTDHIAILLVDAIVPLRLLLIIIGLSGVITM